MAVEPFVKFEGAAPRISQFFTKVDGASAEANGVWYFDGTTAEVIFQRHLLMQYATDVFYIQAKGSYSDGGTADGVNGGGGYSTNPTGGNTLRIANGDAEVFVPKGKMSSFDDDSSYSSGTDGCLCFLFFGQNSIAFDPTGKTGPSGTGVGNLYTNIAEWKTDNTNTEWIIEYRKKDDTNKLTVSDMLNATETVSNSNECLVPDNGPYFGSSTYWAVAGPSWAVTELEAGDEWWVYFIEDTSQLPEWPITGFE